MSIGPRGASTPVAGASPQSGGAITGLAVGELIEVLASTGAAAGFATVPSGFTAYPGFPFTDANTGQKYWCGCRKADGTGADTPTFTTATSTIKVSSWAWSGEDATTPVESPSTIQQFANTTSVSSGTSTPTTPNCLHRVLAIEAAGPTNPSGAPAGYTQLQSDNIGQANHSVYYKLLGGGSSGVGQSATIAYGTNSYGIAQGVIVHATAVTATRRKLAAVLMQ